MRRGRPIIRSEVQTLILEVLSQYKVPLSINAISQKIFEMTGKRISWNTIRKYLNELVELGKVTFIILPHSKKEGKEGLKVYTLKE